MLLEFLPRYLKQKEKLISKRVLKEEEIEKAITIFQENPDNPKIRLHKIEYKKDKYRYSISIPNSEYRILISYYKNHTVCLQILNHDKYDRINKDC